MSYVAGRGRTARETYPQSPGAGSGSAIAAIAPLSRQRFIDGDTTRLGKTGSASDPFATIAEFMASRTNVSVADATANYVGWVMPQTGAYVGDVAFPPYVSTELRADSISIASQSASIIGNVTWANVAGTNVATAPAHVALHNISVSGIFTVTDDAGAPISRVSFGGDELGLLSVALNGGFDASTATRLSVALFQNVLIGGDLDSGAAQIAFANSIFSGGGAVSASTFEAINSSVSAATITATIQAIFTNTLFSSSPVLTAPSAKFDGPSWLSFLEAGGTRGSTVVLVVGGYNGGGVEGPDITGAGTTNVSLDGGGSTIGFEAGGNHYSISNNTPTGVSLQTSGALNGDTILITVERITNLPGLTVFESDGVTPIAVIPADNHGFVLAQFDATAGEWVFAEGGALPAPVA